MVGASIFLQESEFNLFCEYVEIRGFGDFTARMRLAKLARNPKTVKEIFKPEAYVPFFKVSRSLLKKVNLDKWLF